MKRIASRDNSFFKQLKRLVDDHGEPRRRGETLAEGAHLVAACLDAGLVPRQLVVSDSGSRMSEVVDLLDRAACPPVVLSDALYREATGVASPLGIAAIVAIPTNDDMPATGDVVVLDGVQDAGNVGTVLRTAAAAGIPRVVLGKGCAGVWTPRVMRAGQGAHFGLNIHEQVDLGQFLAAYTGDSVATVARDGQELFSLDLRGPVAWLFGSEGRGLAPELSARASRRATIPIVAGESLNVAAAAAICLFEAVRQRRLASADFY